MRGTDMPWSTNEFAALAGTTVNAVRHYHYLGLLDEPARGSNGYKRYGARDLVQLLRIRRLAELDVPLSRIKRVLAGGNATEEELRMVYEDVEKKIERLRNARTDLATVLREKAPADTPLGFASVASRLSEADQSIIHIYAQLYDAQAMGDLGRMVELNVDDESVGEDINALPADADERIRQCLAERLVPTLIRHHDAYPWLRDPTPRLRQSRRVVRETLLDALAELYNPAQRDVLTRALHMAKKALDDEQDSDETEPRYRLLA